VTEPEGQRQGRERDERYEQLVELAPDAILVHDGGRIVLANAAAVRLAGATRRAQILGQPIETFLDPPYLKAVQAQITDAVSPADIAPPVRDVFRRLDGTTVEVEVRAVAFVDQGRPSAHLVIRDIRARLAAERSAWLAHERLQDALRMESVGALAGGVAHEVNNKLQVILGFSGFLVRDPRLPAESLADVREIVRAADRAAAVTRQLLAFSRRAVHRPRVVDLAFCVRESEPAVRHLLGDSRELVIVTDAAPRVWADAEQLEQVIIHLVLNARDAMPEGGTFTLTTAESEIPVGAVAADGVPIPPGRYAMLRARDTGTGIAAAIQPKIFEPFFSTKPVGHSTGLGLAAAHGVLTQNNGYITVESAPGKGATFTLYLPLLGVSDKVEVRAGLPRAGAEAAPPVADAPHTGSTILVVDDEPAVLAVAARILEAGGFDVRQASDGADALEMVERYGPPRLVLTDLLMRGIGGTELARRLKERWPSLPVIFMSGYSAEELYRQGAIDPAGALIQKPFSPGALVAIVAEALARVEAGSGSSDASAGPSI
jgi:two-component system, cell cycle sensor histidine kinase and response regulator CckA